ncbi:MULTISPECIES: recombinase family protein [Pseudomonadota]|uniref:recombinase family protein n=1 Tax=Pseudomonadota TaxID=1224 RepID=UPI0022B75A7C|nr:MULTISPECIES: recombinase family protein [Pseudomonadota]
MASRRNVQAKSISDGLLPAAEYVRMSTDHQRYSTENQADAIRAYAAANNMRIVRTYRDEGKSGLDIGGRDALKQLLADVRSGCTDFKAILVYDVSRWGRFQNADESAAYEYECAKAGIKVVYCAEPFDNDGSPLSTIYKSIKRSMAGEYSRELSTKVFAGQCRLVKLGFHQGGLAGFGLRRALLDEQRNLKGELNIGEQKSIQTDRVVLVPGPPWEVATVERIYRQFVRDGKSERQIADELNAEAKRTDLDRAWSRATVHQVLTNEKYIGNNVYNRTSSKLKQATVRNPPERWVRCDGAFEGIISLELFTQARQIIASRSLKLSDAHMLELLATLWRRAGTLSGLVIDESEDMPSSTSYQSRFGGLLRAYALVGYTPDRDYRYLEINRSLRASHPEVVAQVMQAIRGVGGEVVQNAGNDLLHVNGEWTASVVLARSQVGSSGNLRWNLRFDTSLAPDITCAVRMDSSNNHPLDHYLIPRLDIGAWPQRLGEDNGGLIDGYRFDSFQSLAELAARTPLENVA